MKFPSPEFDDAVAALCHGTIGDETLAELHELLRDDPKARDEYLWRVEVHGELASGRLGLNQSVESAEAFENSLTVDPSARPATGTRSRSRFQVVLNVALLLVLMLGGGLWWSDTLLESPAPVESVARFAGLQDCRWMVPATHVRDGDAISSGQRIELSSGSAQVLFNSGASVEVFGPTILEPLSGNSAFLMQGHVRLMAGTPQSKGFTLQTPNSKFVDIGTAFTATVTPDGLSRVDVSEGQVDVVLEGVDSSPRLRAGEALCIEPGERQVMTRIEQGDGTAAFRFPTTQPPSSEDYADGSMGRAAIRVVQGRLRTQARGSGPVSVLLDGAGQSHQDAPKESAFFEDASGGSFLVDLGNAISVTEINSYSWHQHEILEEHRHRATQRFTLYGFAGDQLPDMTRPPRRAGWTRIARVNTDEYFHVAEPLERPSQQACSITAARGEIGRFRYLLWVVHGGTFFGELDVFGTP
jgi:hypothetical protein